MEECVVAHLSHVVHYDDGVGKVVLWRSIPSLVSAPLRADTSGRYCGIILPAPSGLSRWRVGESR